MYSDDFSFCRFQKSYERGCSEKRLSLSQKFFQQETCVLLKKNFNHGLTRKTVETKKFKRAIITSVELNAEN